MDINDLRAGVTVLSALGFVAIMVWAWSRKRAPAFEEAARLPFVDDDDAPASGPAAFGAQRAARREI